MNLFYPKAAWSAVILVLLLVQAIATALAEPLTPQNSYLFEDSRKFGGYSLRITNQSKPVKISDYSDGRCMWDNFALPAGTNLTGKTFTIIPGKYDDADHATPTVPSTFKADGVVFTRSEFGDQAMSFGIDTIIYTWKKGKKKVFFIFSLRSTVLGKAEDDHGKVPYDEAGQMKETEAIMSTFRRLK